MNTLKIVRREPIIKYPGPSTRPRLCVVSVCPAEELRERTSNPQHPNPAPNPPIMLRNLLIFTAAALATATPRLAKRCSPVYDDDYYGGYLPPVACWHDQDTACQPHIQDGTQMLLDAGHGLAVIYGVSKTCEDTIREELARREDGRKTYGWVENHGDLTLVEEGTLVISGMSKDAVKLYQKLEEEEQQEGSEDQE